MKRLVIILSVCFPLLIPDSSFGEPAEEAAPPKTKKLALQSAEDFFRVSAISENYATLRGCSSAYLTQWHCDLVIEIDSRFGDDHVLYVTRIHFRTKMAKEQFIPLRR